MDELTPKQEEVMRLMARGLTNGQIAERMGVTLAGAKWHVSEVLSKLGVASREEAVAAWRAEHGTTSRLRGLAGLLFGAKAAIAGATAAGVAGVFVVASLVTGGGADGDDGGSAPSVVGAASSVTRRSDVFGGACQSWNATYDGVPLCAPLAVDEVRYSVEVDGARITARGLAGSSFQYVQLVLADNSTVLANVNRPASSPRVATEEADGGGFFFISGSFGSPPTGLRLLTQEQAERAAEGAIPSDAASVALRLGPLAPWPAPQPLDPALRVDYSIRQTGNCVHVETTPWGTAGQSDPCYDPAIPFPRGGSYLGEDGYFGVEVVPAEIEAVFFGFEDGTLVKADVQEMTAEDGTKFNAVVLATRNPYANTQTHVTIDDAVTTRMTTPPPRSRAWLLADAFPEKHPHTFTDGTIAVAANENECLSWSIPTEPSTSSFTCVDRRLLRSEDSSPLLRIVANSSNESRASALIVVNADVDVVEIVDAEGNVYRERAQVIPSSPQGLKFVYFDREVAAPARDVRALDAAGKVLETQTGVFGDGR